MSRNTRNLKNRINQQLEGLDKQDAQSALENGDFEEVQERLQAGRNTTVGTEFKIPESIKSLETVQSFKGQVIQGEGACEIVPEEAFSTEPLIDPKTELLTAGTINFTNNFATITDGAGTPTATITGGDSNQPISDLIGSLTGHPSLKTEKKKFGMNLVGAGSPEGLKSAFEKGQELLSNTNDAIKTAHNAAGGLKFVKNDIGKAAVGKATSLLASKISGLPDINSFIPNPEDLADQTEILSGNKALAAKTKVAKAKLAKIASIAAIVGTVAAFKDKLSGFVDKAKGFVKNNLGKIATGLIVGGVLQEITEKVGETIKNKIQSNLGKVVDEDKLDDVKNAVAEGKEGEATKGIVNETDLSEKGKDAVKKAKGNSAKDFKNDVEKNLDENGATAEEKDDTLNKIDLVDKLVKELNPTISGTLVKDADFYGEPVPIGENIPKWAGERTGDDAFTYVASVEELNSEMMSISRRISEVVIHATETAENKNIGSIEINNIHKQLGHDGIVYHYVIRRDGRLQRGRPADRKSDHTAKESHNNFSLSIALVGGINLPTGDVNPLDNRSESGFTREQFTTLERFIEAFFMKVPGGLVFGHNDIEINELDPYFDVKDYVEKTFRKTYDRVGNTFEFEALDPDDTEINA